MTHFYDSCPDDHTVRREARRDAEEDQRRGYTPRREPYGCDDANDTYRQTYRREHRAAEYRAEGERAEEEERQRQERAQGEARELDRRQEEEYWAREREAEEAALHADEEES